MKWNLSTIYPTYEDYQKDFESLKEMVNELASYKGKLANEKDFVNYMLLSDDFNKKLGNVFQYSSLLADQNLKDIKNSTAMNRVYAVLNQASTVLSFENPEILSIGEETILKFVDNNKEIAAHRFPLEKIFHANEHVLSEKEEKLMSYYNSLVQSGASLYSSISTSDFENIPVTLSNKTKVMINPSNYTYYLSTLSEPKDRKKVFEALYKYYDRHKTTLGEIYKNVVNASMANANARGFNSILESYLFPNNIPTSVYHNLVDVASTKNKSLKKYIKLRKKYLHLSSYHTYDRLLELAKVDDVYDYTTAKDLFFKSIEKMPAEFIKKAHEALDEGYVDVYPSDGKRSGAYSSSVSGNHPFILLNYTDTLDDVFTVVHEAGHSIHSLFSNEAQPSPIQDYTIFVAEIASTFNEHMLLDYFIKNENTKKEVKIQLLQKAIDSIVSTFYRQTLFAHYELLASEMVQNNEPINYEVLSNIMISLYKQYYGLDINKEIYKKYVWAYIPHLFRSPFYVYQYATSFAASFKLYHDVSTNVEGATTRYLNLLKSGGSKYPVDQAKEAGIDFTVKDTFMAVVDRMDELVTELEKLLSE